MMPVKRLLYFLPRSLASLNDLDQAMAVGAGALTLFFSIYEAVKKEAKPVGEQDEIISTLRHRLEDLYRRQEASPGDLSLNGEVVALRRVLISEADNGAGDHHGDLERATVGIDRFSKVSLQTIYILLHTC
jgi:hypothetical protein